MTTSTQETDQTSSHEEFWVFSQVSQWGSHWVYSSNEHLNNVRSIMMTIRTIGIKNNIPPRLVHYAQILLWRFYIKESPQKYPFVEIIPLAFESAALILETKSYKDIVSMSIKGGNRNPEKVSEFRLHFRLITSLDFSLRIHHPSEYLNEYFSQQATEKQLQLAECIISDSYLCPCCLVHKPEKIAEGAALMAAGMTNSPQAVIPKSQEALSFVKDMQYFYTQSMGQPSK
ncbi:hypothetical protein TRFO_28751 [Tritrichomonas foetus]|uniref:Cyclin, N-terminal domain containing protein n=1 Tax=Tritrichomonas foetus TaxID=1144522 RepID=A0A1J4JYZ0_9EUKA|nr:hypothetical protein TRFO_28751 [Tritrichomonas foetus]|eukprot:OHT03906.1 hypothetical protein TRFO_28751 [Tritrichomonas foetus]